MYASLNSSCRFSGETLLPRCKALNDSIFSETVISFTEAAYVIELAGGQVASLLFAGQAESHLQRKAY